MQRFVVSLWGHGEHFDVGDAEMILVAVGDEEIIHIVKPCTVHLRSSQRLWAKVNQIVFVHQQAGALARHLPALANALAKFTIAEWIGIKLGSAGSEKQHKFSHPFSIRSQAVSLMIAQRGTSVKHKEHPRMLSTL